VRSSIDAVLQEAVHSGAVPNIVAVAAGDEDVIYEGAAGPRAVGGHEPVGADSIFRIASMTKMVCTVAALQQRDRGNLDFDAPVDTYCPDFAAVQVLDGFDDVKPRVRAPASRATVRQLVTHTTGLAYGFWNADILRWEAATETGDVFTAPMVTDPGTKFEYGISTDWLGKVVEAASGQSLNDYLADHIFAPLGMRSTGFLLTDDQRGRCVPVHVKDQRGDWVSTDIDWDRDPDWWSGGHGLYSTPRDYLRFQRMLLGGGTLTGTTILDRSSVREAFTNQIGDLWFPAQIRTADPTTSCDGHQGGELVLVVVLGGIRPSLVRHPTGRVRDAGALLRQLRGGPLGVGERLLHDVLSIGQGADEPVVIGVRVPKAVP
jgi:methyl acetate hydrolase